MSKKLFMALAIFEAVILWIIFLVVNIHDIVADKHYSSFHYLRLMIPFFSVYVTLMVIQRFVFVREPESSRQSSEKQKKMKYINQ